MTRFGFSSYRDDGDGSSDSDDSDRHSRTSPDDWTYSDDDASDHDGIAMPQSQTSSRTRLAWDPTREGMDHYQRRWGYTKRSLTLHSSERQSWRRLRQSSAHKDNHHHHHGMDDDTTVSVATSALLQLSLSAVPHETHTLPSADPVAAVDKLVQLWQASRRMHQEGTERQDSRSSDSRRTILASLDQQQSQQHRQHPQTQRVVRPTLTAVQQTLDDDHRAAADALRQLLQSQQTLADRVVAQQQKEQQEEAAAAAEQQQQQQRKVREAERQAAKVQAEESAAARVEGTPVDPSAVPPTAPTATTESSPPSKSTPTRTASTTTTPEYVLKAHKLRAQLVQVIESVKVFETSKVVSKRRLAMKKIVNGRINTLAENVSKIHDVATEVVHAIETARADDKAAAASGNVPSDLQRGKRFFVNLLATNLLTRVSADGFNGPRGDGFPLAAMVGHIAHTCGRDVAPVVQAHVYTTCPVAIPTLPTPQATDREETVLEGLGLQKVTPKDGSGPAEYETFDRFLARTESIISLMANIMASEPSTHVLFGGHAGAVKWLVRFLALLPPDASPLPLVTAPVLDAFLTGAGHMLANVHADEFKPCLDTIVNDIAVRLDESAIGMPSATRLRKTIAGGLDGFKTKLPSRAMPELYVGATVVQADTPAMTNSSPFANSGSAPSQPSPFGGGGTSSNQPSPFGNNGGQSRGGGKPPCKFFAQGKCRNGDNCKFSHESGNAGTSSNNNNPFAASSTASNSDPFGASSSTSNPSPFGGAPTAAAPSPFGNATGSNPSPFGAPATVNSSPFGSNTGTQAPSPFGAPAASAPSPFGAPAAAPSPSPFGSAALTPSPSPFGAAAGSAQAPSPFGAAAPAPSPFGASATAPMASPFGAPAPSPFGAPAAAPSPFGAAAPGPSPFGAAAPSPFGAPAAAASPFGGAPATNPSPFGAGGAPATNPSPFGAPAPSPFGSPAPAPSPFGMSNASPFGGGMAAAPNPSPFGSTAAAPNPSPFGAPASNSSPFGNPAPAPSPFSNASPFGQQPQQQQTTPFGGGFGGGGQSQAGGSRKAPCKFFAQGRCRFGNNCKFSHETGGGGGGFGGSNPFGGPRR